MELKQDFNNRILVCDDNPSIHKDFQKALQNPRSTSKLREIEDELFGDLDTENQPLAELSFQIDSAFQGQEALEKTKSAADEGNPYAVIFMDVRMPPGWDGILTTEKIWQQWPTTEVVIVTAYSDYTWEEMIAKLGINNRLLFLKKPFDTLSVKQLALNLTNKWNHARRTRHHFRDMQSDILKRMKKLEQAIREM
jgi:CheY-like chemotaxis protein